MLVNQQNSSGKMEEESGNIVKDSRTAGSKAKSNIMLKLTVFQSMSEQEKSINTLCLLLSR